MDWIERWFGLYPDGGDGSFEAFIIVGVVSAAAALVVTLSPRARRYVLRALYRAQALVSRQGREG